jgi:hypothetical protein
MGNGAALIEAERLRQVNEEGWTPEHDAHHCNGELALAGVAYALAATGRTTVGETWWPWPDEYSWNPGNDELRMLVKAGALIAAEIDRLQLKSKHGKGK